MSAPRGSRAMVGLLVAVVFVAGIAAGVIGDRLIGGKPVIRTRVFKEMGSVLDRLELTGAQRAQAESILARRAPRSEEMMIDLAERLRVVSDSVDAELRAILTPEQRLRLDSLRVAQPSLVLKRKVIGPEGTTIDTFVGRRR